MCANYASKYGIPSDRAMALGSTQFLVKMGTRHIPGGKRRPVREADNLTTLMCRMSLKPGSLNLLEPSGHTGPVMGLLYLYCISLVSCRSVHLILFAVPFVQYDWFFSIEELCLISCRVVVLLHCSLIIIRMIKSRGMKWEGNVARMGDRGPCRVLIGRP
jgi:hypothetical protein